MSSGNPRHAISSGISFGKLLSAALERTYGSTGPSLRDTLRAMHVPEDEVVAADNPASQLTAQGSERIQPNTLDGYVPQWREPPSRPPDEYGRRYWEPLTPHDMFDGRTGERIPFDGFYDDDINGNNIPDQFDNTNANRFGDYLTPRLIYLSRR